MLAVGWLLPIHYAPWTAFHNDAWVSGVLSVLCLTSLYKVQGRQTWSYAALVVGVLCVVPVIQFWVGQIQLPGTGWISSVYLLGFLLAILTGARWQHSKSSELANALFLAFGIAACVSVGMQLCQWLNVTDGCFCGGNWILPLGENRRAAANLAQPNQLATLLLFGTVAFAWAWLKETISGSGAIFAIAFLLFGLTLTDSRTGVLSTSVMWFLTIFWRRLWPSKQVPFVATGLLLFFVAAFLVQSGLANLLLLDGTSTFVERGQNETRWDIWRMFTRATLQQPWLGYGWNQSAVALVLGIASDNTQPCTQVPLVSYAHNLFLDLILWVGIPLGISVSAAVLLWLLRAVKSIETGQDALLMCCIVALGVHAMLEIPLYHAYFLLPLGLMIGMLEVRLQIRPAFVTGRRAVVCLSLIGSALFVVVVRDYFVIEQSYSLLRLDSARIQNKTPYKPPEVLILTQIRDYIALARLAPTPNMSQIDIKWVESVTLVYPSEFNLLALATVLALNGQALQAGSWLNTLCKSYPGAGCQKSQAEWERRATVFPQLLKVSWPVSTCHYAPAR